MRIRKKDRVPPTFKATFLLASWRLGTWMLDDLWRDDQQVMRNTEREMISSESYLARGHSINYASRFALMEKCPHGCVQLNSGHGAAGPSRVGS